MGRLTQQLNQQGGRLTQQLQQEEPKKGVFGKVAEFIAPTTTRTVGKLREGEKLTARDIAGSALEVGSFLIPAGGIAKGLGYVGKGALTLGRKLALGSTVGAVSGATYEAGRTIGQEGTGFKEVAESTARGAGFGALGGAAIPAGIAGARAVPKAIGAISKVGEATARGAEIAKRGIVTGAKALKGAGEEAVTAVGKRVPEKVGQFVEKRAEQKARTVGKPAHVQEAVRKNIEQPIIDFVRNANPADKALRVKMLDIAKKGTQNLSFRGQAKQIPGQTIVKGPLAHLLKTKDVGVAQTKRVLDKLGDTPQNVRPIYDQFIKDISESGIVVSGDKLIKVGPGIPKNDISFYQEVYDVLRPDKSGKTLKTFRNLHKFRQEWFDVAKTDKTFTSGPTNYARRLRSLIGQPIDKASQGKYIKAQTKTREALEGIQEYVKLTGFKGKLENVKTKDLKAGEVFLRIFGNAADRPTSVLDTVYSTAKKYGYKGTENIQDQLRFADILEDIYGAPTRGIRGQLGRADPLSKGLGAAREAAKWSPVSAALRLTREFLSGTADDTLKAFENLIRIEGGQKIPTVFGKKELGKLIEEGKQTVFGK